MTPAGEIDEAASLALNGVATSQYDAPRIDTSTSPYKVYQDADGRPVIDSGWTSNGTKIYEDFLSSSSDNLTSWVIETGDGSDVSIDFEHFAVDPTLAPPPLNPLAPYPQDVLVIYDATAEGATEVYLDKYGRPGLRVKDSSLLIELMALTGSGINVLDLKSAKPVNSRSDGAFTVGPFTGVSRVALILYSHLRPFRTDDDKKRAAGFRLIAAHREFPLWSNWEIDPNAGEVWVHKSNGTVPGAADDTAKKFIYEYFSENVSIDPESGTITFGTAKTGTISADYSYYSAPKPSVRSFLLSDDDVVENETSNVYVARPGVPILAPQDRAKIYEDDQGGGLHYGRVVTQVTWDKDRGVVTFNSGSEPANFQRVFSDYRHHTYKRLTSDNLGDLTFEPQNTIVPALVAEYPDYTWTDIKVTNEGTATLNNGEVKFTFRGYDSDNDGRADYEQTSNPKDQVLDHNRPWDVQMGTKVETVDRLGVKFSATWVWTSVFPRTEQDVPTEGRPQNWSQPWHTATGLYANRDPALRDQWGNGPQAFAPGDILFGRVVWHLGAGGTNYPSSSDISVGEKRCSIEASGTYFDSLIFQG